LGAPSKVRAGDLYTAGAARYDPYFGEVHALQVRRMAWPLERKGARKPLLEALKLNPDVDDAAIAQSTRDHLNAGLLHLEVMGTDVHVVEGSRAGTTDSPRDVLAAVELAAHAEIERGKELSDLSTRIDTLEASGHDLEAHIREDFAGRGQKPFEVREELRASYEVLSDLKADAARERQAADHLVADLARAVSTGSEVPAAPFAPPSKSRLPKATSKPESRPTPRSISFGHAESSAPAPSNRPPIQPPPPKPATKSVDAEVFNP
jgi:hypothetical protein